MSKKPVTVSFSIENRQRKVRFPGLRVRNLAHSALPLCLEAAARHGKRKKLPSNIEASIVSDKIIAQVHADFMDIEGPTDVITFPYGEILVSAETARRNARAYGQKVEEEIALYLIHGVLHLLGFDDIDRKQSAVMNREQQKILKAVLAEM